MIETGHGLAPEAARSGQDVLIPSEIAHHSDFKSPMIPK